MADRAMVMRGGKHIADVNIEDTSIERAELYDGGAASY